MQIYIYISVVVNTLTNKCALMCQGDDEQWERAMEYVSVVSELNYMTQVVIMLYEDPTKDPCSEQQFHVELHFSPGVNLCVETDQPPGTIETREGTFFF